MKVLIGSNLIDTEMICYIGEVEGTEFIITFIGGTTKVINIYKYWLHSKENVKRCIGKNLDWLSHDDIGKLYRVIKLFIDDTVDSTKSVMKNIPKILELPDKKYGNEYLWREDAIEATVNLRQKLIDIWEPNQSKILKLD